MPNLSPLALRDRELFGKGLAEIRRHRRVAWLLTLGFVPGGVLLSIALNLLFHSDVLTVLGAGAWFGLGVVANLRVSQSKCPRCGQRFHKGRWWSNPWTSRCMTCRLHLRADEGAV
jgi:hypothetical protein